ncbi:MAG: alanine--tRNA ligase, partial [Planctomycetes bacterium]|nr:alanine--tRNA ligase [Planctomycetota bacterium]
MRVDEVRERFLAFFAERGHTVVASSPVIPHGDPTLLFTNAGMNQFKDALIGRERRPYTRAASCQKCIRAGGKHNDLENVGYTARHLTFFEMLGNFSFGDYFKGEAIRFAWELVTAGLGLDAGRLWVTVYRDDEEARAIWRDEIGVPKARIVGLGEKDNFWSMGDVGPCGPCSEILFDRGKAAGCGPRCGIGRCDCDRYFEVWNLVFMQYDQASDGSRTPLEHPSIDTGMGLERIAMVLQGAQSVYETDVLRGIIRAIEERSAVAFDPGKAGIPHRVIADHIRSLVFAFADGAYPSNEGRGYVLRRILRRAARYGREIGFRKPFLWELAAVVEDAMAKAYPEIAARRELIERTIRAEEERFNRTLDQGLAKFEETRARLVSEGSTVVPGREVFLLYDTYGFPVDLVERMAAEAGLAVDREG